MSIQKQPNQTKNEYSWIDSLWLSERLNKLREGGRDISVPINVYELNLRGFARRSDGLSLSYTEIADVLVPYLKFMGYTHVEIFAHSICSESDEYIFPSHDSAIGSKNDFKYLINSLHLNNLGVIFDCGILPRINSRVQKHFVNDLLKATNEYHIDGLKFALTENFTEENSEQKSFCQAINNALRESCPDVITIASSQFGTSDITKKTAEGGLGFTFAWNSALISSLYDYFEAPPLDRIYLHKNLAVSKKDLTSERYIIPIHRADLTGNNSSLINKINGSYEDKFKQLRALLLLYMTLPGKKHLFMGTEYAQFKEWSENDSLEWFMLDFPSHFDMRNYVAALNRFYLESSALWTYDNSPRGFEWISKDKSSESVLLFKRKSKTEELYVAVNLSPYEKTVSLPLIYDGTPKCVFSSVSFDSDKSIAVYRNKIDSYMDVLLPPYTAKIIKENTKQIKIII